MFPPVSHRGKLSRTESAVEGGGDLSDREEAAGVEDVERLVGLDVDAVVPPSGAEELLEVKVALRRIKARHAVRGALKDHG